ncbi:MAG: chromosomal replication initiator protein DnaA [Chloroflexota bacterium]
MRADQAWQAAIGQLQLEMNKANFETWVRNAEMVSYEDGEFIVGVKNAYARDWLTERLSSTVTRILTGIMNRTVRVNFVVWHPVVDKETFEFPQAEERPESNAASAAAPVTRKHPALRERYTFDTFVVGTSNRMAHAACLAVAENPARSYNPLFLYGGVGLGKTHLLHAIGNECHERGLQVLYVSSEEFTNDFIDSLRQHKPQAFREKYRQTDVLLIDDIQFIAGKEETQGEFFHTFNTLHGQEKQIVMTSDRPPKAMVTLEDRLRSRFEWGLAADIQPPDFETRIAILRYKAEQAGYNIDSDILGVLARRVQSNIRELEGALTRIVAYANLSSKAITPSMVETVLIDMLPNRDEVEPERIMNVVADVFGISIERMLDRDRSRQAAVPRQFAMYLLREDAKLSLPQIGEFMGGRDHTTVMYACDKIAELIERDDRSRRQMIQIRERLYGQLVNVR